MKRVATIILNRNLPEVTENLYNHIDKFDGEETDIYVVEAGCDEDKLSSKMTWFADWEFARKEGLRYSRGMNFGLSMLLKEEKFFKCCNWISSAFKWYCYWIFIFIWSF